MKNFFSFILKPPTWLIILTFLLTILFSSVSLFCVLSELSTEIYAFIFYTFAAIFLTYAVYLFVRLSPLIKKGFISFMNKFPFTQKLYNHYSFRTATAACGSILLNMGFAIFEITISIISKSVWWGALGAYHLILSLTRVGILVRNIKDSKSLQDKNQKLIANIKTYQRTGICILVLNFALLGAAIQMMFSENAFSYAGLIIYAMATYAFWKIGMGIWGLTRFKKHNSFTTQSFRCLNLTDALVTLFALQTALIATFGTVSDTVMEIMNIITGSLVLIISTALSVYMIVKANKNLKNIK